MTKWHIASMACIAALIGVGLGAAPQAVAHHRTHVVFPGQSIQKAVNAAAAGDTVLVTSGKFRESVRVSTPGITLRGMGRGTVVSPPAKKAAGGCADGNGICVIGTKDSKVEDVTVAALTVTGFTGSGVFAQDTDGLTVRHVTAVKNGVWGIAQERSVRGVFRKNTARDNGDAGLFLANTIKAEQGATDSGGTVVAHNRLEGNRIGLTVRRLRNLTVADNHLTGNCAGVFVVGDENKPRAGALTVRDNLIDRNNKSCPKTARLDALQGIGIVLTGTEDTLVTRNRILGNVGASPLSGGIVVWKSFVGTTSQRNRITDNLLEANSPADIVNTDTAGKGNTFTGNTCRASKPAGLC
ncbi:right-handed parallel beta-helix repeat-containing protein [Streptomyces europaeiscabiei]|uniref:right-handed parallel beta-helix repeat-containing protein n=2 Tax=Streptomyces TaxID=1883 RepID=UPI0029B26FBD|nr:right-handed parallel beta-helix repeat-containing protein [Streptomyces europaeiscabiei]MDX3581308.1 right-handed parallel beta-helix repeat-containing protein [Streptomyces europaeiscabiei]MDX3616272.1 right-handed parallel beta-helix repeat-containing protein [Streptomyces europaeiscabiei]MDX3636421.1 right-handed parallel beta-helix repeat-containing protein [Streptomyces europaeiscabiei]MDX3654484.1 right-handed parallel beta-helix repeat-containing protein [Streptomyces europaeiscabiei